MGHGLASHHFGLRRALFSLALALLVSSCGGGGSVAAKSTGASAARAVSKPVAVPRGSRLLLDAAEPLSWAFAGNGSLYFSYASPVGQHVGEAYELLRVNTGTGRVAARRRLIGAPDATTLARGALWLTTTAGHDTLLWRLDPASLGIRSKLRLPSAPANEGISGSLAAAGGQLWVGTGLIVGVSLRTGRVDRVVSPGHPGPVQLEASPSGRVLLASLGYQHPTYIARLNPETGATLSELTIPKSDTQASVGAVAGGGAWIENRVGSKTSVRRISLDTMKVAKTSAFAASRGISVRAIDGVLWVTEPVGQNNLNYCADPVTGHARARLPLLRGDSVFLTADKTSFFYTDVPINAHEVKLERAPLSRACTT